MTNYARFVRGISVTADCVCCPGSIEDTLHILQDCNRAWEVWRRMVPSTQMATFMGETEVRDWLEMDISSTVAVNGYIWGIWFSIICYYLRC